MNKTKILRKPRKKPTVSERAARERQQRTYTNGRPICKHLHQEELPPSMRENLSSRFKRDTTLARYTRAKTHARLASRIQNGQAHNHAGTQTQLFVCFLVFVFCIFLYIFKIYDTYKFCKKTYCISKSKTCSL